MGDTEKPDGSGRLAELLAQLNLPDEQPDWNLRRENLTALVDSLSPWEVLHLRSLVKSKVIAFRNLTDLPAEILNLIAESLELKDILACILVSKSWNLVWKQEYVASSLIRHFFPGLVEMSVGKPVDWPLFYETSRKYLRRASGKYISSVIQRIGTLEHMSGGYFVPNPSGHPDGKYPQRHPMEQTGVPSEAFIHRSWPTYYRNGKIAWQLDYCCVVIDDLYARHRQVCRYPGANVHGYQAMLAGMSNKLLVTADYRHNILFIFHLELNEWHKLTLPNSIVAVFAGDDRVGVTTHAQNRTQDAFIWQWGKKLLPVENIPTLDRSIVPGSPSTAPLQLGFLFHPLHDDVFFILLMCSGKLPRGHDSQSDGHRVVVSVSEYKGRELVQAFPVLVHEPGKQVWDMTTTCSPMNTRGSYSACVVRTDSKPHSQIINIGFNVFTKQFSVDQHLLTQEAWGSGHDSQFQYSISTLQAWNGQIYLHIPTRDPPFTKNKLVPTTSHVWAIGEASNMKIRHPNVSNLCPEIVAVEGDDKLLVVLTENGYIVWNFDSSQLMDAPWEANPGN